MSTAIITNKIFLEVDEELSQKLRKELTYYIPHAIPGLPDKVMSAYGEVRPGIASIPKNRRDLVPEYYKIVDNTVDKKVVFPKFRFKLRETQEWVANQVTSCAFINANPAFGKTFTGLYLAGKLSCKTLVIVHTEMLRDMWVEECEKVYGITPDTIGDGKFNYNSIVTVATIQTLAKRPLNDIVREFGTVIVDECHHCPAKTFTKVLATLQNRHTIGLSASDKRTDLTHVMFPNYFSKLKIKPPADNYLEPVVDIWGIDLKFPDYGPNWATKLNDFTSNPDYINILALITQSYINAGHYPLVVSARVKMLKELEKLIPNSRAIVGETKNKKDEIAYAREKGYSCVLGSINLFTEGINIPALSALVLGTPTKNEPQLEQLVGRVTRNIEDKLTPTIVDIRPKGNTMSRQALDRDYFYMNNSYKVTKK